MKQLRFLSPLLLAGVFAIAGCGGSGSSPDAPESAGRARIAIDWGTPTRLVPDASNSVTVSFLRGSNVVATRTVERPAEGETSTFEFDELPAQTLTLRAQAFPNANGTGVAQASATKTVSIVANRMNEMAITMVSTVETVSLNPTTANLGINGTRTFTASPTNSTGSIVLLADANTVWTSSDPSVASVDDDGLVNGLKAGTATIRFTDTESGKFGVATVNVSSGLGNVDVEIK
jgi:hypothetical protein